MEKWKLLLKMIRYNKNAYKMYLYCNIFAVSLFTALLSIYQNNSFSNNSEIDGSISSNVFAPTVLMGLFLILFIPYAYTAFLKGRKQEYAVFMVLGMTESEVVANMFLECSIVSVAGGITGLIFGSGLSFIFLVFLHHIIGLRSVQWECHIETYKITVILYACAVIIILCINILRIIRSQILELFKAKYKEEKKKKGSMCKLLLGLGIFCIGILLMTIVYDFNRTYIWFFSIGFSIGGIAVIICNLDFLMRRFHKKSWKISLSFVLQNIKSWRIVTFISACLFGILIFFLGHGIVTYPNFKSNAITYSPYDLFYVTYQDINNIGMEQIEDILNRNEIHITEEKTVEVLRGMACNIINADEINEKMGRDFQVEEGEFIQLFQIDQNDGYEHDTSPLPALSVNLGDDGEMQIRLKESCVDILFNSCKSLGDFTLIISDTDFKKIKMSSREYLAENAVMINFDHWRKSEQAIEELQNVMEKSNGLTAEDQYLYRIASKLEKYTIAVQSSSVLVFFMFFVAFVFWSSANAAIYFKMKSELEEERRIFFNLYRVGILEKELQNILLKKNFFYYFVPFMIGGAFGIFYCYSVNAIYDYGIIGLICGGVIAIIICMMQMFVCWRAIQYEYHEFVRLYC